ncbi:hypothetical protein AB0J38_45740 [Streptomyces sp. NPDC050095]|uniref:hypothetical protein n=1 Tax=unclassified Streptomyces TaxID=2593676 RepID=UPI003440FE9B
MNHLKRTTSAILICLALAGAGMAATTASAGAAVPAEASGTAAHASAGSPYIEGGGVSSHLQDDNTPTECDSGYLCVSVWDAGEVQWRVFEFYNCKAYNVQNWEGDGYWLNMQTGGAVGRFYGERDGRGLLYTTNGAHGEYNWHPVNSIRPC